MNLAAGFILALCLPFPHRMYTQSHFDYAAKATVEVKAKAHPGKGVKIAKQNNYLRHCTAKFRWA